MPMQSIPASDLVNATPGVLGPGGTGASLIALAMTNGAQSWRLPIGTVQPFPTAAAVGAFFGLSSNEYNWASVYFAGFNNSAVKPASLLMAQYPAVAVPALLRSGALGLTLAQINAIAPGTLTITIDGNTVTSSTITLTAATSPSNAASIIQTALGENDASATGSIAPATASLTTSSIAGTTMTVGAVASGTPIPGAVLSGTNVTAGTTIVKQLTGSAGGAGTYQVSISQTVASTTITATSTQGVFTAASGLTGTFAVGQVLTGAGVTAGTSIVSFLTGVGGLGTYVVSVSQTASSTTISAGGATVAYDSVQGVFTITGGTPGATGSIGYASGAVATALGMTQATGAVLSQGSAPATPAAFMGGIVTQTTAFASFNTLFEPSTADGLAFSTWNSQQNNRYVFNAVDTDPNATLSGQTTTLGAEVIAAGNSGTALLYEPSNQYLEAFVAGTFASIDFNAQNGRVNPTYKGQAGLPIGVTSQTIADQLVLNGYNFMGQWATATQQFQGLAPGQITGPFAWLDAYVNQIWLNSALQTAAMNLLFTAKSFSYNAAGYALIRQALSDPIQAGLFNGVIQAGVTLSALQIAEVNAAAGVPIDGTLFQQGWYLQILPASPTTRAERGSPPITFWYTDGGSIQRISLFSEDVQ